MNFTHRYSLIVACFLFLGMPFVVFGAAEAEVTSTIVVPTPLPTPAEVVVSSSPQPSAAATPSLPVVASSPEPKSGFHAYSSVHVDGPYIAMTFDDGPSATLTPRLLNILKERGIKATFFMIGENAASHPEVVARVAAEGHEIGNHSWSHPMLTKLSEAGFREQLDKTSDAIAQATGKKPVLMRPPYGAMNQRLIDIIEGQYGMKVILWSVDPNDWKRPGAAVVSQRIIAGARPGSIILSHDIHPGTIEAMPATLDALKAKGYQFVTVSELIAMQSQSPLPVSSPVPSVAKKHKQKKLK